MIKITRWPPHAWHKSFPQSKMPGTRLQRGRTFCTWEKTAFHINLVWPQEFITSETLTTTELEATQSWDKARDRDKRTGQNKVQLYIYRYICTEGWLCYMLYRWLLSCVSTILPSICQRARWPAPRSWTVRARFAGQTGNLKTLKD